MPWGSPSGWGWKAAVAWYAWVRYTKPVVYNTLEEIKRFGEALGKIIDLDRKQAPPIQN